MRPSRWSFALCWMIVGATTMAAGLGGWGALHREVNPTAAGAALLKVDLPDSPLDDARPEPDRRLRLGTYRRTHAELLRSPNVLSGALQDDRVSAQPLLAGKADPIGWLAGALRVDELGDDLLAVSMPGETRDVQAVVVNAVVEQFLTMNSAWASGSLKERIGLTRAALAGYRDDLASKRRALREGAGDPERQAALRDEIGVLEELARLMAKAAERDRLDQAGLRPAGHAGSTLAPGPGVVRGRPRWGRGR